MMKRRVPRKAYLLLTILSFICMIAVFVLFVIEMATGDTMGENASTFGILITVLLYMGAIGLLAMMMAFSLIRYFSWNAHYAGRVMTKKCTACGTEMPITELSCPRCFVLQPADGNSRYGKQ